MDEATEKIARATASAEPPPATASATTKKTRGREKTAAELQAEADAAREKLKKEMAKVRKKEKRAKIAQQRETEAEAANTNLKILQIAEKIAKTIKLDCKHNEVAEILASSVTSQQKQEEEEITSKKIINTLKSWGDKYYFDNKIKKFCEKNNRNYIKLAVNSTYENILNKIPEQELNIYIASFVYNLMDIASQTTQNPDSKINT